MELKDVVVGMKVDHRSGRSPGVVTAVGEWGEVRLRWPDGSGGGHDPAKLTPHLTLPLEAGKRYVRRDGSVTAPLEIATSCKGYWYTGTHTVTSRGALWSDSLSAMDLIADYVDVSSMSPQASEGPKDEPQSHLLPTDAAERKKFPVFDGFLNYFPDACLLASRVSYDGNQRHAPGQPLQWVRSKSTDQDDALVRHLMEARQAESIGDVKRAAYLRAQVLWRAAAGCQLAVEKAGGVGDIPSLEEAKR